MLISVVVRKNHPVPSPFGFLRPSHHPGATVSRGSCRSTHFAVLCDDADELILHKGIVKRKDIGVVHLAKEVGFTKSIHSLSWFEHPNEDLLHDLPVTRVRGD